MEKQRNLDRLATVSKVFMDSRVVELRRENEELRLRLFWKDHNVQMLEKVMKEANQMDNAPKCNCFRCVLTERMDGDVVYDNQSCTFIPWFEEKIKLCDLTTKYYTDLSLESTDYRIHVSDTSGNPVFIADCHFVKYCTTGIDWGSFSYGSKLWKAKTVNDPELRKLEKLFELMGPYPPSDE